MIPDPVPMPFLNRIGLLFTSLLLLSACGPQAGVFSLAKDPSVVQVLTEPTSQDWTPQEAYKKFQDEAKLNSELETKHSEVSLETIWVQYQLVNPGIHESKWLFDVWVFPIERLEFYSYFQDQIVESKVLVPAEERFLPYSGISFQMPPHEQRTLLFKITPRERVRVPFQWMPESEYEFLRLERRLWEGLLYGVGIALALYNLFLYFSLRERSYLLYFFYSVLGWFGIFSVTGYLEHFLPHLPNWYSLDYLIVYPMIAAAIGFAVEFLELKERLPRLRKLSFVLMGLLVSIAIAFHFISLSHRRIFTQEILDRLVIVSVAYLVYLGVHSYLKGYKPARFYLMAWSAMFVSAIVWVLEWKGVMPVTSLTPYRIETGLAAEMILMSWALADRLTQIRKRYEIALSVHSEKLEAQIRERTAEVERKNVNLVQTARMAALGEMASGMAHEINNPLTAIENNAVLLKMFEERNRLKAPDVLRISGNLQNQVGRIAKIISSLQAFSKERTGDPFQKVRVGEIVQRTLDLCQERFKYNSVQLDVALKDPDAELSCRPGEVSQALLHLLSNAFVAAQAEKEKWVKFEIDDDEEAVEFRVIDSGAGIPREVEARIFDPFFTTRPPDQGTGLGLSFSQGIARSHQGTLEWDPNSPFTLFRLRLPKDTPSIAGRIAHA